MEIYRGAINTGRYSTVNACLDAQQLPNLLVL